MAIIKAFKNQPTAAMPIGCSSEDYALNESNHAPESEDYQATILYSTTPGFVSIRFGCERLWISARNAQYLAEELLEASGHSEKMQPQPPKAKPKPKTINIDGVNYKLVPE